MGSGKKNKKTAVLLVDDSAGIRMLLRNVLESLFSVVEEASDGEEALRKIEELAAREQRLALAIVDYFMPGMDGLQLVAKIRSGKGRFPILMLTTESTWDKKEQGRKAGVDGWVVKPIDTARFLELVKELTGVEGGEEVVVDEQKTEEAWQVFQAEMRKRLAALREALEHLRHGERDESVINRVFRELHSIKGEAGSFGCEEIASCAHQMEELFQEIRAGRVPFLSEAVGMSLKVHEALEEGLRQGGGGMNPVADATRSCRDFLKRIAGAEAKPAPVREEEKRPPRKKREGGKLRILVADDELNNRILLKKIVGGMGDCDIVVNGVETVEAFEAAWSDGVPYDLILLDIMMPEMDGQTALKEIRRKEAEWGVVAGEEAIVFMVTALDSPRVVLEAFYRGFCTDYLTKPLDPKLLKDKMKEYGLLGA